MKNELHQKILKNTDVLQSWFDSKTKTRMPFYCSFDLRDSEEKISIVDANLFPGGFHLTCTTDQSETPELIKKKINNKKIKNIGLICESPHIKSLYWLNIICIKELLEQSGFSVFLISDKNFKKDVEFLFQGKKIFLPEYKIKDKKIFIKDTVLDYLISNSDFSLEKPLFKDLLLDPPYEFGWHNRKKINFFNYYNDLVNEFCHLINFDPFYLRIQTEEISQLNIFSDSDLTDLSLKSDIFLKKISESYKDKKISYPAFLFLKQSSGTYGRGVIRIDKKEDILKLNRKQKDQLKTGKESLKIKSIILQEGLPSAIKTESAVCEPVIYMIGDELMGGFLRVHPEKTTMDNLNSPGAIYKNLCLSDLKISLDKPLESVYGWLAKIGFLALCKELSKV